MFQLLDPTSGGGPSPARGFRGGITLSPPASGGVVTPSDSVIYDRPIMVWVGDAGPVDVKVAPYGRDGDASLIFTLKKGMSVPVLCKQVFATGTTAVSLFLGSAMPAPATGSGGGAGITADTTTVTADTTTVTADNG